MGPLGPLGPLGHGALCQLERFFSVDERFVRTGEPRGKFLRPTAHEALHLFRSADLVVGLYHGSEIQRVTVRKPFSHSFIMSYVCIYWFDIF